MTLTKNPKHRALLTMTAGATMFGFMAFFAKIASLRLSGPEVVMFRMSAGLIPVILIARYRRAALQFQRVDLLLYRGFFGGVATTLYFLAIQHTTAGVATLLNYTSPIWSGTFSMLFIGERFSSRVIVPVAVALSGVFLVVRTGAFGFSMWEIVGLCSGVASGAAVTAMRAARRGENSWSIYASFCLFGTLVSAPLALQAWKTPMGNEWFALAATSLFAMGAQLMLTFSLRWLDAVTVGVISQLAVLISITLGAVFLAEVVTPLAALGSALTISGVIGVTYLTSIGRPAEEAMPEA